MITGHLPELVIVLVVALIFFGPSKLPEVGNAVGRGLREFRRATSEIEDAVLNHDQADEFDDPNPFPHTAPEPVEHFDTSIEPTVDKLGPPRVVRGDRSHEPQEDEVGSPS